MAGAGSMGRRVTGADRGTGDSVCRIVVSLVEWRSGGGGRSGRDDHAGGDGGDRRHYCCVAASICRGASSSGLRGARGGGEEGGLRSIVSYPYAGSVALHGQSCTGNSPDRNQG